MSHSAWRKVYQDALLEVDPIRLPERIEAARQAIDKHRREDRGLSKRELQDIDDALRILGILRKEVA
jgi:hypothetical protein